MTNDFYGGFVAGVSFIAIVLGVFQIGLNKGVQLAIKIIDDYPAAKNVLIANKKATKMLPFISEVAK